MMKTMKPFVICITGGIGSGKSVVSRVLRLNGYPVYDCDSEAKVLMETDPEVREGLKKILGNDAFFNNGKLNRKFVASIIFSDSEKRREVNGLVHEAVRKDFKVFARKCSEGPYSSCNRKNMDSRNPIFSQNGGETGVEEYGGIVFCETAIPVSSHLDEECDEIWLIEAPEELRIRRVVDRSGLETVEIRERMTAQNKEFDGIPQFKKKLIDNGGDIPLLTQIFEKLEILKFSEEICLKKF